MEKEPDGRMGSMTGKNVLVVEDEYFIAADLTRSLTRRGIHVVGPTANLCDGLSTLDGVPVDAAILDVNLQDENSLPIADELIRRSVPFLFLTGYDGWAMPQGYRQIPRLAKPCPSSKIIDMLQTILVEP